MNMNTTFCLNPMAYGDLSKARLIGIASNAIKQAFGLLRRGPLGTRIRGVRGVHVPDLEYEKEASLID